MKLKYLAASMLALSCASAMAEEVELKVIGAIVPEACDASFTGGGEVAYGNRYADILSDTEFTLLEEKTIGFTLNCPSGATTAGIRLVDNRGAAGVPAGIVGALPGARPNGSSTYAFAAQGGKQVGAYSLRFDGVTATTDAGTNPVDLIYKNTVGGGWVKNLTQSVLKHGDGHAVWNAFAVPGNLTPVDFTTLTGNFIVQAALNKAGELDLSDAVPMDGLATMHVAYY